MKAVPLRCKITSVSNIFSKSRKRNEIYKFGKGRKTVTFQRQNNCVCRKSLKKKKTATLNFWNFRTKVLQDFWARKQLGRECNLLTPIKTGCRIGNRLQLASKKQSLRQGFRDTWFIQAPSGEREGWSVLSKGVSFLYKLAYSSLASDCPWWGRGGAETGPIF